MHELQLSAYFAVNFFLIALATEAVIEIVKTSDLSLAVLHSRIVPRYEQNPTWYNWTLYKYITCGQCMSVVYSIPGAIYLSTFASGWLIPFAFVASLFALQRATNWLNTSYQLLQRGRVNAVELVSPIQMMNMSGEPPYNPEYLLSEALERENRKGTPQTVRANTLDDIKRIIKKLKVDRPGGGRECQVDIEGQTFRFNTSTNHPPYMEIIRDAFLGLDAVAQDEPDPTIEINAGESLVPLSIGQSHGIDPFIAQATGGIRDGNRIKWEISQGTFFYDPVNDKLTMADPDEENSEAT